METIHAGKIGYRGIRYSYSVRGSQRTAKQPGSTEDRAIEPRKVSRVATVYAVFAIE
ncbi:MAG: hypothetical protein ABSG00_01455 [Terracidiphilus sp.]|jgi:hypothetical protein